MSANFRDECSALARLQTFDPLAFQADAEVPQDLCNFVLSLALIYNDCKDAIYARLVLGESMPSPPRRRIRLWGAWDGVEHHLLRIIAALLHELLKLVRDHRDQIAHPFFASVVQQLNPSSRAAWQTLVSVANDAGTGGDPLGQALLRLRHKSAFHYDPNAIYRGYHRHFLDSARLDTRAYISRGERMTETRFYFADAAATGWMRESIGKDADVPAFMMKVAEVLGPVNQSLMSIVGTWITRRGFAFRAENE